MKTTRLSPTKRTGSAPDLAGVSRRVRAWVGAIAVLIAVTVVPAARAGDTIIYVNAAAAPGGNGTSWGTAFQKLSDGLNAAGIVSPQACQVWVAEGIYTIPAASTLPIPLGTEVYGGFVGGETSLSQRDFDANPTIISGDTLNNSTPTGQNISDDATGVIAITQTDSRAVTQVLDGFTIEYARARLLDIGGGAKPRIENCTFRYVFGVLNPTPVAAIRVASGSPAVLVNNTIHTIVGANSNLNGSNGASGNAGTNGTNGGNGGTPSNGGSGGIGGNGQPGGSGGNGGPATGIHLFGGSACSVVNNRIFSIFGGDGATGGNGGTGGRGGNGGSGGNHTAGGTGAFGGNGGRGGLGGNAGAGGNGGFAYGILYDLADVTPAAISNNLIYNLLPGDGGFPGVAGVGGGGGTGGQGGSSSATGGKGGNGGDGGNGGLGGQGGGAGEACAVKLTFVSSPINLNNNTADVSRSATAGPPGGGGAGGAAGTPGTGGSGSPNGANGFAGSPGTANANGDNGATPSSIGVGTGGGSATVSAFNSVFRLPSTPDVNAFLAQSTGAPIFVDHSIATSVVTSGSGVSIGSRMLSADPNFFNTTGQDGIPGTDDDDYSLRTPSLAVDAGSNNFLAPDTADLDRDGNASESTPLDLRKNPRLSDVPGVFDQGAPPVVDMGAFEADVTPPTVVLFEPSQPNYTSSPATFALLFDRPVSAVPLGLVSVNTTGDVNVTNLSIDRITDQFFTITAAFTSTTGGTLAAVVSDFDTITSQVGVPLNGVGSGNVTSTSATINAGGGGSNPPTLVQGFISGENTATPNSAKLFGFEFSEAVTGVDQSDFTLVTSGISGAFIESVFSLDGVTWTVEIDTGSLSSAAPGTIAVRLTDDDSIQSTISGDPLDGPGSGNEYNSPVLTVANPADCNNNSVPDSLDIQNGTSQDCNDNNVPDECDIAGFAADQSFGPLSYFRSADSPFSLAGLGTTAFLEDFEDGALNTPGVAAPGTSVCGCGGFNDSVDADDGSLDGSGSAGQSIFIGDGTGGMLFTFDASAFGQLPQYAGVVFTDGGLGGTVTFEARDGAGNIIGSFPASTADGSNFGTTAEDRFFGIVHAAGIGSIRIRCTGGGLEADHLQYGLITGLPDSNQNGIPDECEQGTLDANYTIDNSWRMNPFPPAPGWDTSLNFDDSNSAGWAPPVFIQGYPDPMNAGYWSFPGTQGGSSETYLRKKVRLLSVPAPGQALLTASADDDVAVFVNGSQVVFDTDCLAGPTLTAQIHNLLVPGENLIAVRATDCGCCGRSVGVSLQLPGIITDCNNNGVPDRSEIASIAVPDTNNNGVPDPCELTGPDSPRPWPFDLERAVNTPNFPQGAPQAFPLRAADIDDDGLTDFVTTGPNGPRLIIRGGPGELMYFNSDITASGPVFDTAVADFNLDGRPDLVCATGGGNALRVFRCTNFDGPNYAESGTGGTTTAQVVRLAVIDANSDGYPDLVGLQADGLVTLFTNTSTQSGAISMVGSPVVSTALFANPNTSYAIDAADFDKDGREDIVFVAGGLAVLRNAGNGSFNQIINDSTLHTAAAFVDLSGNERPLVVAGLASGGGEVIDPNDFARSLGTFTGAAPAMISPADIDGDGREDFAVVGVEGTLSWHRQEFLGQLNSRNIALEAGLFGGLVLADIDPDGDADFCVIRFEVPLARNASGPDSKEQASKAADASQTGAEDRSTLYTSRVNIIPNRRLHILADINGVAQIAATGDGPSAAAVADMDRDGRVDLVTASFFDDTIAWHALDYEGPTFWSRTNIITSATSPRPDGPSSVATADFDGDGDIDVVACGILNGQLTWFDNTGGGAGFVRTVIDTTAPGASCIAVADFDLNGTPDIATGNSTTGQLVIYRNFRDGTAFFQREVILSSGLTGVRSLAAGDIDNDGRPDIVAACFNLNRLRLFTQQDITAAADPGPGGRGGEPLDFFEYSAITQSAPTCVTLADFNNDGNLDIASASSTENSIKVRLGDGNGNFLTTVTALSSMGGASWVHAVDLDADGLTDLAATGRQNNTFYRAKNTGNGTSWQPSDMFMQPEGPSVCVSGDFDGDGKTDLAVGSFNTDRFTTSVNYGEAISAFMTDTPSAIAEGEPSRFATIFLSNDAKPGDPDVTYTNFIADFYTSGFQIGLTPVPLTSAQLNALISRLEVFADADGDFAFTPSDPSIGFLNGPFTLDSSGRLSFTLPTPAAGRSVAPGDQRYFFAVATTKPGASAAAQNRFGLYLTISDETFADTTFNEPVLPRYAGQYVSGTIQVSPLFRAACPTDMDASGRTDTPDLVAFLARFGTTTLPFNNGDFSGDGRVGTPDLVKLLSKFGSACE